MDFNKKFSNFIWDFDGTLFDTYPIYDRALQKAIFQLNQQKLSRDSIELIVRTTSMHEGIAYLATKLGLSEARIQKIYESWVSANLLKAKPFPGASITLNQIKTQNGQNFLITHNDNMALQLLDKFNLSKMFTDFIFGNSGFKRKPNPESLNYLLKKYQLSKKETIYIGDRFLDVAAAHNANIASAFFAPNNLITVSEAEIKITTLNDLLNYLK